MGRGGKGKEGRRDGDGGIVGGGERREEEEREGNEREGERRRGKEIKEERGGAGKAKE